MGIVLQDNHQTLVEFLSRRNRIDREGTSEAHLDNKLQCQCTTLVLLSLIFWMLGPGKADAGNVLESF
jgi:hypothetical protein